MEMYYEAKDRTLRGPSGELIAENVNPQDGKCLVRAVQAADLLVQAYALGAERGGSMEWEEVDQAYEVALLVDEEEPEPGSAQAVREEAEKADADRDDDDLEDERPY